MPLLQNAVMRHIAGFPPGHTTVLVELVNWAGVPLMLHKNEGRGVALPHAWSCSHELTGYRLATGPSPETALACAICSLRPEMDYFRAVVKQLPVINPIVIGK